MKTRLQSGFYSKYPRYSDGININNSDNFCDACEKKVTDGRIHQTETGLLLCMDCCHYVETLPGVIEESLERFLFGLLGLLCPSEFAEHTALLCTSSIRAILGSHQSCPFFWWGIIAYILLDSDQRPKS
jgi:hypothetical protein